MGSISQAFSPVCVVFGASGHVGQALVPELIARGARVGARVIAHVRPDSPGRVQHVERLEQQAAELLDCPFELDALLTALRPLAPTHLFVLVGTTAKRARAEGLSDPYEAIDVGLVVLLLEAARQLEKAPRIVYLSAVGASARARSAYLRARWRAEEAIRASGLPYTLCRAGLIAGPDRHESRPLERVAETLLRPLAWTMGAVGLGQWRAKLAPFRAAEIAHGLVHAGFNYSTSGRVLGPEELRYRLANDREWNGPGTRREDPRH